MSSYWDNVGTFRNELSSFLVTNRESLIQIGIGVVDIGFGIALTGSAGGAPPGLLLIAVGADQVYAGINTILTGQKSRSLFEEAGYQMALKMGYSEETAGIVGQLTPGLLSLGAGIWGGMATSAARMNGRFFFVGGRQLGDAAETGLTLVNVAARGQPFSFGGLSRSARSGRLIYESSRASGYSHFRSFVDRVLYNPRARSPYFWVDPANGERLIVLDAATFGKMRGGQLITGTHEFIHSEQWAVHLASYGGNLQKAHPGFFIPSLSPQYAIREVLTEREALRRVMMWGRGINQQQVGHSTRYIEGWQQYLESLGFSRVP